MQDNVIYASEMGKWYKQGVDFTVRNVKNGQPVVEPESAVADTYFDAFTALFSKAVPIPAPVRAPRRVQE